MFLSYSKYHIAAITKCINIHITILIHFSTLISFQILFLAVFLKNNQTLYGLVIWNKVDGAGTHFKKVLPMCQLQSKITLSHSFYNYLYVMWLSFSILQRSTYNYFPIFYAFQYILYWSLGFVHIQEGKWMTHIGFKIALFCCQKWDGEFAKEFLLD